LAIAAVLDPLHTNELYFVADGTGGAAFASTLEEHARNVARWREIERSRQAATELRPAQPGPTPDPPAGKAKRKKH